MVNNVRTLQEATGIEPELEKEIWDKMPTAPYRKLLDYEFEKKRIEESLKMTTGRLSFEEYLRASGVVDGLRLASAILTRNDQRK